MKVLIAAFAALGCSAVLSGPAAADPKLDFLGLCISQGNSTTYCGCMTDAMTAKLKPTEFAVYIDYLQTLADGERDQTKIINKLEADNKIDGPELGRILQIATDTSNAAEKSCAGQ